jgi:hypothetical protein
MEEGEERGLAERAAMAIKARVGRSLAGGDGALNVAARLPPTEAVALYDFVAEHPDDLGLPKGTVVVLTETAGEKDTARHGQAQHDGIGRPSTHTTRLFPFSACYGLSSSFHNIAVMDFAS